MKDYIKIGRKIAKLLRHDPEDLKIDKNGYVIVEELLKKININQYDLDYIVKNNDKKRFVYNQDRNKIRAAQGHSIKVDVELKTTRPPNILYQGTTNENFEKIKKSGEINKMKRLHVHLTEDKNTAYSVGKRHSKRDEPALLKINSAAMYADGFKFYLSENDVWLTNNVPIKYVEKINF